MDDKNLWHEVNPRTNEQIDPKLEVEAMIGIPMLDLPHLWLRAVVALLFIAWLVWLWRVR